MSQRIDGPRTAPVKPSTVEVNRTSAQSAAGAGVKEVAATAATDKVALSGAAVNLASLEKTMAQAPVVDQARVAAIKAAIADGSYKVDPKTIASRLTRLEWQMGR